MTTPEPEPSTPEPEPSFFSRISERPRLELGKLRDLRRRDLVYRFLAGALTSIAAGIVGLVFGIRVGGVLLAFPAILAASLTLIEDQEAAGQAREDAGGAVVGAVGLCAFAAVAAATLGHLAPALALALATVTWLVVALAGYLILWFR